MNPEVLSILYMCVIPSEKPYKLYLVFQTNYTLHLLEKKSVGYIRFHAKRLINYGHFL